MAAPGNSFPNFDPKLPGWLKIDFHLHSREDPKDDLEHSAIELLHRARALGFNALAITLHNKVLNDPAVFETARELGLLLIPAVELRLEGADVVVVNLTPEEARGLRKLSDLVEFRQRRGRSAFIFAPHPFYKLGGSMGGRQLSEHIDLFDAIEICHFHTSWFDPNRNAIRAAERFQKPLIATSDTHRLAYFGDHYSLVQAPPDATPEMIFDAIRAGCIRPVSPALTNAQFVNHLWWVFVEHRLGWLWKGRAK
jgi:predicted metal-dependent phosphoesterase TrpH